MNKTLLLLLLLLSSTAQAQSPQMDRALNLIYNGLGTEDLWNTTLEVLDDIVDDLEDDNDLTNDEKAELKLAQTFYDFFGEISPYAGSNYDLKEDDFNQAIQWLNKIGVDTDLSTYRTIDGFRIVKLELWEGNVTSLLVHNHTDCLHRFAIKFSTGDSMTAGADAHTYRAYNEYGIDEADPNITSFSAENVGYQPNCKQ